MKGLTAVVAIKGATNAFDKLYTYALPPELYSAAKVGMRATVPFGRGNIQKECIIFKIEENEIKGLKKLTSLTDETPVLSEELIKLCEYMRETVFCTYYDAVASMLPVGLGYKSVVYYSANDNFLSSSLLNETETEIFEYLKKKGETEQSALIKRFSVSAEQLTALAEKEAVFAESDLKRKVQDATQKWVRLAENYNLEKPTARQQEIISLLEEIGSAAVKEICYFTGVTVSVIDNLIKKGVLIAYSQKVYRYNTLNCEKDNTEIVLNDEQQKAYEGLCQKFESEKAETSLLYGVTGSGKTKVFLKLCEKAVKENRGVIVMVPEISLTPQLLSIFTSRFGNKVAVFHSAMSMGKRLEEWRRVKDGKAQIAIGTRSAIFAPFEDLGLIIIDEEQEHTYKSEKSPRFHARDLARFRTAYHKGLTCLSSATPSLESYTKAKIGSYSLFTLKHRFGNAILPEVETVDMKKELLKGNSGVLSTRLYEAIKENLEAKKQTILLLNRRGHNTYITCSSCGHIETCPNCSVSLTYHSANGRLMCHYCGYSKKADTVCPECSNPNMKFSGLGTQKAEEELKSVFPNARVLRLDADSTACRESYSSYLSDFARGEYDILIGTQMVAKGLDFPNVTLVGVLGADKAMYSEDFRSFERSFSLLAQVVGRAGRGNEAGKAIIQTSDPESTLIELARTQDYDSFYNEEILTRKLMIYPPYCDICMVSVQSLIRENAEKAIKEIFENIKKKINGEYSGVKVSILAPSVASISKINNRYRYRMIIKCKNNSEFRKMLREAMDIKYMQDTVSFVDMNPESVL